MKSLRKFWAALMILCMCAPVFAQDAEGTLQIQQDENGVYQIGTAQDLRDFAAILAGDGVTKDENANAVITADIDYTENFRQIGGNIRGIIDGQGHTITVDIRATEDKRGSLFNYLYGTIKNLVVAGRIENTAKYAAGICSFLRGGVIQNCIVKADIYGGNLDNADATAGGIVAQTDNVDGGVIDNCAFIGSFRPVEGDYILFNSCGGLVGWADKKVTISNCLIAIDVSQMDQTSCNTISRNPGNVSISNVYYTNAMGELPAGLIQLTDAQIASGEACFLLNQGQDAPVWFQKIGTDMEPSHNPERGVVYMNGRQHCDGSAYDGSEFSNTDKGIVTDEHDFVDGICSYCHTADVNFVQADADGFYNLSTPVQMKWFAALVNHVDNAAKARLVAPIDFTDVEWTAIGSTVRNFTGTFDGQLFEITNLNGNLFGTTSGAVINGIAIESGVVTVNTGSDHTGSIVGQGKDGTIIANSYSKATMAGGGGDLGGIAGKYVGTLKNVFYAGTFSSALGTWSMGGLVGSTNSDNTTFIEDCFVFAELESGFDPSSCARGAFVGWCHGNTIKNSYVLSETFTKMLGDGTGSTSECEALSAEDFMGGAVAWKLNKKTFVDPAYYQNVDEDLHPVLDKTHGLVYPVVGGYASASSDNFAEMRDALLQEAFTYCDEVVAQATLVEAYKAELEKLKTINSRDEFAAAYMALGEQRAAVEQSEKDYAAYMAAMDEVRLSMENSTVAGADFSLIEDYLGLEVEPCELYPNGTYSYIISVCVLDAEQLAAETAFVQKMLADALLSGFQPGDEITRLLANADLAAQFEGWTYTKSGNTFTAANGVNEVMPAAESWDATYDINQTLTGLTNGVYELRVNAAFRGADDLYNSNYAAWAYANGNEVYVMTEGEDVVSVEDAVDMENCWINGGKVQDETGAHIGNYDNYYETLEIAGYVPYGPVSCSYAFKGGRYVNTIMAVVTDGTLTVGLKNLGTGNSADWSGFGNFRLFYQGDLEGEMATGALDRTLAGQVARANTILNVYVPTSADENYTKSPSYPATLKAALKDIVDAVPAAADNAAKLELVERFTQLYKEIYEAKKTYVKMMASWKTLLNTAYALVEGGDANVTEEMIQELAALDETICISWEDGVYSLEEASELKQAKETAFYQYLMQNAPALEDGVYQLAKAEDLQWVASRVAMGLRDVVVQMVAPIDMKDVEWQPIGTTERPFSGKFYGGKFPITNLSGMLFGTTNGAVIDGVAIESATVADNGGNAHTGGLVGAGWNTTLTNSYSKAIMAGGGGDLGGLGGKFTGTIRNCYFAGKLTSALGTWSMGGLVGSSEGDNSLTIADCYVFVDWEDGLDPGYGARGAMVGWCHTNCAPTNSYAVSAVDYKGFGKLLGDGTGSQDGSHWATADEFASGKIAYALNGDQSTISWYQTLGQDACPVLDATHLVVVLDGEQYVNQGGDAIDVVEIDRQFGSKLNVYGLNGQLIRSGVSAKDGLKGLPRGMYIIGGRKVMK